MTNPFSRTTLWIVIGVALASLGVMVALTIMGPPAKTSAGSDGYSVSAIGHQGLVRLLEQLDVPVVLSRNDSATKAKRGLLVIAEPKTTDKEKARLELMIADAPRAILVVLPKWYGYTADDGKWIADAQLQPITELEHVLAAIGIPDSDPISRTPAAPKWTAHEPFPLPVISSQVQGIAKDLLVSSIDDGTRTLLGHFSHEGKEIWVLADPDVLNNAGLREPANAALAVALIDRLREGGPVVFDETVHGNAQAPSLLRVLFEFPLVLATMQVLICAVLVLWAAMVRFGPKRAPPPPLSPGKDFLIANTAALLRYGGHDHDALERYLAANVQVVRRALHAPELEGPGPGPGPGGDLAPALVTWLEHVRKLRGARTSLVDLQLEIASAREARHILELADQVYRWRQEMIHGSSHRT